MNKKITVKPFLNKNLAAQNSSFGEKLFPLYYQVTFNRKNTQFKSNFDLYLASIEETNSTEKQQIQTEIDVITKIINTEKDSNSSDYSLMGLKQKHEFYLMPVDKIIQKYLLNILQKAVNQCNSEYKYIFKFENNDSNVILLFKACKELIDNISKYLPDEYKFEIDVLKALIKHQRKGFVIANWMDENIQNELKAEFTSHFENIKTAENAINFIENVVGEKMRYL